MQNYWSLELSHNCKVEQKKDLHYSVRRQNHELYHQWSLKMRPNFFGYSADRQGSMLEVQIISADRQESMLEVQIISTEMIKPSSTVPQHLQKFKLSLLDQLAPPIFVPLVLFYSSSSNKSTREKSLLLKRSLSETLAYFYPFAGRIREDYTIHCNDEGVEFSEALVTGQLLEFVTQPDVQVLSELLPCDHNNVKSGKDVILAIQANIFQCGGMAIGIGISHFIADGSALLTFLKSWASMARGEFNESSKPCFNWSTLFPSAPLPNPLSSYVCTVKENLSMKRFVFSSSSIASLRCQTQEDPSPGWSPTRFEAVAALIWRCFIRARPRTESKRASVAMYPVNVRGRTAPPLPENSIGNLWVRAVTAGIERGDSDEELKACTEKQLREATSVIDSNHIKQLQHANGFEKYFENVDQVIEKYCSVDFCYLTSWLRFPFYELDLGWGKPVWVSRGPLPLRNVVILLETREGDGVEAWVNMEKEEMATFEEDPELLSYASQ